jgi:hypothetical protein
MKRKEKGGGREETMKKGRQEGKEDEGMIHEAGVRKKRCGIIGV